MRLQEAHDLMELDLLLTTKNALQLTAQVNKTSVIRVLKSILLDVLPEGSHDSGTSFLANTKHWLKLLANLESFWSVIEPEAHPNREFNSIILSHLRREISWDLKTVESGTTLTSCFVPDCGLIEHTFLVSFSVKKLDFCSFEELKKALLRNRTILWKDLFLAELAQYATFKLYGPSIAIFVLICFHHESEISFDFLTSAKNVFLDICDLSLSVAFQVLLKRSHLMEQSNFVWK